MHTYSAMMIKSINTFVTTSAMFTELAHLNKEDNHYHIWMNMSNQNNETTIDLHNWRLRVIFSAGR